MAIRVTQNTMYNNMVSHMQSNLSGYMESVQQGASQKKINRPSDDPAGTYRVLTTRNDMVGTAQYQENVDTAKGWLQLADSVLSTNVTTAITGLKALAEQASTGTYTAQQRMMMADQARQYFGQLLNLSNTQFEDMHLFGGHKYDQPAFQQILAPTTWDEQWADAINSGSAGITVDGASERTVLVQYTSSGDMATLNKISEGYSIKDDGSYVDKKGNPILGKDGKPIKLTEGAQILDLEGKPIPGDDGEPLTWTAGETHEVKGKSVFQWSNDGGETWNDGKMETVPGKDGEIISYQMSMNGVSMRIDANATMPNPAYKPDENGNYPADEKPIIPLTATAGYNTDPEKYGANNGTFLYIRPTAQYMGDDKDPAIDVTVMGAGFTNPNDSADGPVKASGTFGTNVLVRIDGQIDPATGKAKDVDLNMPGETFTWSYSTDGGNTWVTCKGTTPGGGELRLPVPGGYVDFDLNRNDANGNDPGHMLKAGMQLNIHPSRADLDYEIMKDTYLSVNSVGKDVFGGYYEGKPAMSDRENNLFEVVGAFIGYLEGNNQEGCQRTLAALEKAEKTVLAEATRIGGMENRVEMAADVLSFQKLDQQERLSYTEDIDLTELLTRLTRQQLTYQTVLQSSSMIMQMSLLNYV